MLTCIRKAALWFAALALCAPGVCEAAWGLKYQVRRTPTDAWTDTVNAAPGETIYFRFGSYFDIGTKVTVADGQGNAVALARFTGSNQWTGFAAGDVINQPITRTISSGNAALVAITGSTIGGTAVTSFGSQLFLGPLPDPPETYREIYVGSIHIGDDPSARTLTFKNKTWGSGATKGQTFFTDSSPNNKQSAAPDDSPNHTDMNATVNVIANCPFPAVTGPAAQSVCIGDPATLSVSGTNGPLTYQWRKNTVPIPGATDQLLHFDAVTADDAGSYDCGVTNACSTVYSASVPLAVNSPPAILAQPVSVVSRTGTTTTLSVAASGLGTLQYQWKKNGSNVPEAGRFTGTKTAIFQISNTQVSDAGPFACVITDPLAAPCTSVTTAIAQVSVGDCTIAWRQAATAGPGARRNPGVAYDSVRGRLVLFGGSNDSGPLGDTWEWDGSTWAQKATTGPSPRTGQAMTYDSNKGRVLLFGGYNAANIVQGDTWSWNGGVWTQVASNGPSPRFYSDIAYDSVRQRVVLFGGIQQNYALPTDTWTWDGTAWVQVTTSGPPGRYAGAMAFDTARQRMVLFGGFDVGSNNFSDTWEWNGSFWTMKTSGTPTARTGSSMAFDPGRGRIILFGGRLLVNGQTEWSASTWEWDGVSWLATLTGTPSARWISGMALDTTRNRIVLFGGEDSAGMALGDTWEFASRIDITQQPTSVSADYGQTAVFTVVASGPDLTYRWRKNGKPMSDDGRVSGTGTATLQISFAALQDEAVYDVVIAGPCGQEISQQATLTVAACPLSWSGLNVATPSARWIGACASDMARKQIVLFGGRASDGGMLDETWIWNGTSWAQKPVAGPSARSDHAMASLFSGVLLFGGKEASNVYLGDTWYWDGTAWTQITPAHSPPARLGHTMAFDSTRGRIVLFGGDGAGDVLLGDTWEWTGADWEQVSGIGPPARFGHQMTFDSGRGRTVLFGGALFTNTVFFDTWEWDGVAWAKKFEGGPSAQIYGSLVYDPQRARSIMVGGFTYDRVFSAETWEWNGFNWFKSLNSGPAPRQNPYVAYDPAKSRVTLFGGFSAADTALGDMWALVFGPAVISPPQNQTVAATHTAIFSVSGSSPGLHYLWLRNGVGMSDGGRISGTHSPTLSIASATAFDVASYRAKVTDACGLNVISSAATLTVTCTADLNGNGLVDDADFSIFAVAYDDLLCDPAPAACAADLNADGFVDDVDFGIFVVAYNELICP